MARNIVLTPRTGPTVPTDQVTAGSADTVRNPRRGMVGALSRGAPLLLPLALFVVLQPETYSIAPNPLDPFFYSGLAINFDDVVAAGGDGHYFISRWSAYLPMYLSNAIAGPIVGRLVLRLIIVSVILGGLWKLRPEWTMPQRLLTGTLVVSMPMFLRAFFSDYVEYALVSYVAALIVVSLRERQTWRSATVAGVLVGLVMVSNPIGLMAVIVPLAVLGFVGTNTWADRVRFGSLIVAAFVLTLLAGFLYFRWLHGIANVYTPTVDFIRTFAGIDQLRSPRREWLWYFTWLWATPLMLAVIAILAIRGTVRFDRMERSAFAIAASQYLLQWVDQFARHGNGLEISYYWSMSYPSFAIALGFLVARLVSKVSLPRAAAAVAAWCALLIIGVADILRLPAGLGFAAIAIAVGALVCATVPRWPALGATVLVVFVAFTQIAAPLYDPSVYHPFNMSPGYDKLFWADGETTETMWDETVWFERQMDRVEDDAQTKFVITSEVASLMIAVYQPQITGRRYPLDEQSNFIGDVDPAFTFSEPGPVAFYGDPSATERAVTHLHDALGLDEPVLDETNDGGLGFRLVVYELAGAGERSRTLEADRLSIHQGTVTGTDIVVEPGSPADFVSFGPYVPIDPGRYLLTLLYSASAPPAQIAGSFEAFTVSLDVVGSVELPGTDGEPRQVSLSFESVDRVDLWEFRTRFSGTGSLTVDKIILEPQD